MLALKFQEKFFISQLDFSFSFPLPDFHRAVFQQAVGGLKSR
jgi:hypothetical protein